MAWSTFVTAALWVTCLGLFFQAVGYAIPFWLSFVTGNSGTDFGVYIGVWYVMSCIKGESDSCKSKAITPEFEDAGQFDSVKIDGSSQEDIVLLTSEVFSYNAYWWAVQLATTVGIFLTLLAALILICCRCAGVHSKCMFITAAITLFFGGLISLGISVLSAIVIAVAFDFADFDIDAETFPWSVLLFGIGGIEALVASIMILIIVCKWQKHGAYEREDKDQSFDDVPMSHVNDGYGRDPYDSHRKEYNNYDRARYGYDRGESRGYDRGEPRGYDRGEPRGYGGSRKYDGYRDQRNGHRDDYRDNYRDSYSDRGYDYDRGYSLQSQEYMYRPYNQHRY